MNVDVRGTLARALADDRTVVLVTIVAGEGLGRQVAIDATGVALAGDLGRPDLDDEVRARAMDFVPAYRAAKARLGEGDRAVDVFVEVVGPAPQLVIVGAVHVAIPLVHLAKLVGYRTVVVDPRAAFATPARFGHADLLLAEWPDEAFRQVRLHDRTVVAVLSHDLKIDIPALAVALRHRLPYVGALGSRKTQDKRAKALRDAGFTDADLARLRTPIGLDLGGRRAEEIALAIMAEIVAVTHGAAGGRPGASASRS